VKFNVSFNPFSPEKFPSWQQWATRVTADVGKLLDTWAQWLNGQITFGNGTDIDNISGQWIEFTSHAVGGTETAVSHTLGVVPVGFILMIPPVTGVVNKGATAWTTSTIYITVSTNAQSLKIFVLVPPVTA